jgi:ribosomal subunit interface protein
LEDRVTSTQIVFQNFPKTPAIEAALSSHVMSWFSRLPRHLVSKLRVWLRIENSKQKPGKDLYLCRVELNSRRLGVLRIEDRNDNLYTAIHEAGERLERSFWRRAKKHLQRRRAKS